MQLLGVSVVFVSGNQHETRIQTTADPPNAAMSGMAHSWQMQQGKFILV